MEPRSEVVAWYVVCDSGPDLEWGAVRRGVVCEANLLNGTCWLGK
jgi:hypothetical protein